MQLVMHPQPSGSQEAAASQSVQRALQLGQQALTRRTASRRARSLQAQANAWCGVRWGFGRGWMDGCVGGWRRGDAAWQSQDEGTCSGAREPSIMNRPTNSQAAQGRAGVGCVCGVGRWGSRERGGRTINYFNY